MNEPQALAALKRLYGKNAMWRRDEQALRAEERAAISEILPALREAKDSVHALLDERRKKVLQDDAEYAELLDRYTRARQAFDDAGNKVRRRRVTVGRSNGLAFVVTGEGDNWQEAIDAAEAAGARP